MAKIHIYDPNSKPEMYSYTRNPSMTLCGRIAEDFLMLRQPEEDYHSVVCKKCFKKYEKSKDVK